MNIYKSQGWTIRFPFYFNLCVYTLVVNTSTHIYIYIYIYMCVCVWMWMCVCVCVCVCVDVWMCVFDCTFKYLMYIITITNVLSCQLCIYMYIEYLQPADCGQCNKVQFSPDTRPLIGYTDLSGVYSAMWSQCVTSFTSYTWHLMDATYVSYNISDLILHHRCYSYLVFSSFLIYDWSTYAIWWNVCVRACVRACVFYIGLNVYCSTKYTALKR